MVDFGSRFPLRWNAFPSESNSTIETARIAVTIITQIPFLFTISAFSTAAFQYCLFRPCPKNLIAEHHGNRIIPSDSSPSLKACASQVRLSCCLRKAVHRAIGHHRRCLRNAGCPAGWNESGCRGCLHSHKNRQRIIDHQLVIDQKAVSMLHHS